MEKSSLLIKLSFILISLDSLLVYFSKQFTGAIYQVNLSIPLLLLLVLATRGKRFLMPETHVFAMLSISTLGFMTGIILLPGLGLGRFFEITSALIAFIIGHAFIRWSKNSDEVTPILLGIGLVYVFTCVIALSNTLPTYFPVINKLWSLNGTLVNRPEITTDQNFQIFYLIPGLLVLSLPLKKLRAILTTICFIGSLYTMAQLQTRSGFLVCSSIGLMCVFAPIWTKSLGRKKTILYPIAMMIAIAVFLPLIYEYASGLILRFTNTDYSTGLGRLHSFLYLFDKIYLPNWWLPHGNAEFISLTGNKPHSNPTAFFLEGGLLSLFAWFWLFVAPLYRLSRLFFKRRLDNLTTMLLIGGIAFLITQLSLNIPLMDQIWLWAGMILGAEARLKNLSKIKKNDEQQHKSDTLNDLVMNDSKYKYPVLKLKKNP